MDKLPHSEPAYIRNTQTNDLYRYLGDDKYLNIRTGKSGFMEPELVRKLFKINIDAMLVISGNPIVESLINRLNLKLEQNYNV